MASHPGFSALQPFAFMPRRGRFNTTMWVLKQEVFSLLVAQISSTWAPFNILYYNFIFHFQKHQPRPWHDWVVILRRSLHLFSCDTTKIYRASPCSRSYCCRPYIPYAYPARSLPHKNMLSSASMANFPKSRTSATCPARMCNKSTTSARTLSKEVGTPARFYTDELQVLQRCFNRDRKEFYKKEKVAHSLD